MKKKLLLGLLLACCSIGVAIAQSVTITGKVTGDKGAPLAGVTVQEKKVTNFKFSYQYNINNFNFNYFPGPLSFPNPTIACLIRGVF